MKSRLRFREFFRTAYREALLFLCCLICLGLLLYAPLSLAEAAGQEGLSPEEAALWEAYQSGQLIRLHILADNDHPQAQQIKLAVRDALLSAFGQQLAQAGSTSCHQVYQMLQDNVAAMEAVARDCARQQGFFGSVTAEVGLLSLPEKQYGQITLPAGEYRGLRVRLGSGQGRNWWCVLFPQLCLALADDEPWQSPPVQPAPQQEAPALVWDSEQIFRCWLLMPPKGSEAENAAEAKTASPLPN